MSGPLRNPRHERFAQFIANGKSATDSYVSVGFSEKGAAQSANRLLRDAKICARIAELRDLVTHVEAVKAAIDKDWIISTLKLNVDRAMQETPVLDSKGRQTGEYRYDGSVANRALELLGKEMGMFTDRHEFSGGLAIDPGRESLPDTQLQAMIAAAQALLAGAGATAEQSTETVQ